MVFDIQPFLLWRISPFMNFDILPLVSQLFLGFNLLRFTKKYDIHVQYLGCDILTVTLVSDSVLR